jgi:hypothetical protein
MKIVYPPSEKTLLKIETIRRLREKDPSISARSIAPLVGLDHSYVSALIKWDKENHGK